MKTAIILLITSFIFFSCKKDDCQTCTKTVGGVAGNSVVETREVCDSDEASQLEASSSGTTVWTCD